MSRADLPEPLLTIVVPTTGRRTLMRTMESIHQQLPKSPRLTVEVLVVADTTDGPVPFAELVVRHYENRMSIRYLTCDGGHRWGAPGRNQAILEAEGMWISFMDDDDIYANGALIAIYDAILSQETLRPMIFKMVDPQGAVVPMSPGLHQGNIGTPCIVVPCVVGLLGTWGDRYEGDFDFIRSTMDLWRCEPDWRDSTIAICRPTKDTDWTKMT